MSEQLGLVLAPPAPDRENGRQRQPQTIQERFEDWLKANHEHFLLIRDYAYDALRAGRPRYGIAAIIERVRWHVEIDTRGDEEFKINNDYRSRIVRKLIDEDPRFADLFEIRELKTP